ncbi:MAG: hypothetical protein H7Y16_08305 [Candidatus Parcubacteria bacterium]|nr:hypothetical protein [Burkholderiales bacterium]
MAQGSSFKLKSATRKSAALPVAERQSGEDLSNWLQEAAKRPWVSGPNSINPASNAEDDSKAAPEPRVRRHQPRGRDVAGLFVLTVAYLQYYYLDVMVQISSLSEVVVFLPVAIG